MSCDILDKLWECVVGILGTIRFCELEEVGIPSTFAPSFRVIAQVIKGGNHDIPAISHHVNSDWILCGYSLVAVYYRRTAYRKNRVLGKWELHIIRH